MQVNFGRFLKDIKIAQKVAIFGRFSFPKNCRRLLKVA
jgi:hypothetical protein